MPSGIGSRLTGDCSRSLPTSATGSRPSRNSGNRELSGSIDRLPPKDISPVPPANRRAAHPSRRSRTEENVVPILAICKSHPRQPLFFLIGNVSDGDRKIFGSQ